MVDKRLDQGLIDLNQRYQEVVKSASYVENSNKKRYLWNLTHFKIGEIVEDLKYRTYGARNFSTRGNSLKCTVEKQDIIELKIAVFSCVIGRYDSFIEPVYCEPGVDYFMFTDQELPACSAWKKVDVTLGDDYKQLSPLMLNRKIKMLQSEMLLQYDYTVYVDGNIELVAGISPIIEQMKNRGIGVHYHRSRDCIVDEVVAVKHFKKYQGTGIDKQIIEYMRDGYPRHNGLFENSVIVRDNRDTAVRRLMQDWWEEYNRFPTRDQISFPYVIWKTNFNTDKIFILGGDVERNPRFNRINQHLKRPD